MKFREESNSLYSASSDKKVLQWDLNSMSVVDSIELDKKNKASAMRIDFIKDEIHLLVSIDTKIILYNTQLKVRNFLPISTDLGLPTFLTPSPT